MKKLVVVGDVHLHPHKAFSQGQSLQNSRFLSTLKALDDTLRRAREEKCPWFQAGDWVHTIGFTQNPVLNRLIDLLNFYDDVQKFTVWGNHDSRSAGEVIDPDETAAFILARAVPSLTVLTPGRGIITTKNGLKVYGEGFHPDPSKLSFLKWDGQVVDVGLFHQTVAGSEMPSGLRMDEGIPKDPLLEHFRFSICGDVHEPQHWGKVGYGPEGSFSRFVFVPGSLEQHNFGDKSERGWWVVSIGDTVEWEFIPSTSPKFITVERASEVKRDGNFYRITSPTDPREIPEGAVALAAPPTVVESREVITRSFSAHEILSAWLKVDPPTVGDPPVYLAAGRRILEAEGLVSLRPIRLQRAILSNFLCYQSAEFDIENGITLVLGQGRDFQSNGAGKTSLFEAIYWALFGKTTKGMDANDVIRRGAESCTVNLEFDDGLQVERSRRKDGTSTLGVQTGGSVWGGTPKEVTTQLQRYLGLTPELYQALTYFSQSKLVLFSQATDAERKVMLSDLCGLDIYQKASTAARAIATQSEQEINQHAATISLLERGFQEQQEDLQRVAKKSDEWTLMAKEIGDEARANIEKYKTEIALSQQVLADFRISLDLRRVQDGTAIEDQRPQIIAKVTNQLRGALDSAQAEFEKWKEDAAATPIPPVTELQGLQEGLQIKMNVASEEQRTSHTKVATLRAHGTSLNHRIQKIESAPDRCPTCGSRIDQDANIRLAAELQSELLLLLPQIDLEVTHENELAAEISQYSIQVRKLEGRIEESRSRSKAWDGFNIRIHELTKQLEEQVDFFVAKEIKALVDHMENEIRAADTEKASEQSWKESRLLGMIESCEAQIRLYSKNPYEVDISRISDLLVEKEAELNGVRAQQVVLGEKERIYNYWAQGFSRTGIQSLLMEEVAATFNEMRPAVFPILTNGIYDVQFSTTSKTSIGDAREKTDFLIRDRGVLVSYESLSGGQRRRIDLGVMLTLAVSVAKTRNVPGVLGLMVLDEVFGFLDADGVEALYQALLEVNKVVPAIYAVTHNPSLQSLFRTHMLVEQDAYGISSIQAR